MTQAEQVFNEAFFRTMASWGSILSFRTTVESGLPAAKQVIEQRNRAFIKDQLSREDSMIRRDKMTPDSAKMLIATITDSTIAQAQASVDAASIVFMHSVLDAAALDYCRVTALSAPHEWEEVLKERKVNLIDVRGTTFDQLFQKTLDRYFEGLERESLLWKIDLIYKMCPLPKGAPSEVNVKGGYIFDRGRLATIDDLRHGIIHGTRLGRPINNAFEDLEYMLHTTTHLLTLVARRFGLKLDPADAQRYFSQSPKS